jgi:hypothetical protein
MRSGALRQRALMPHEAYAQADVEQAIHPIRSIDRISQDNNHSCFVLFAQSGRADVAHILVAMR